MKADELVGELAHRTAPVYCGPHVDWSYCAQPARIVKATEAHVWVVFAGAQYPTCLDSRYADGAWVKWDPPTAETIAALGSSAFAQAR